MILFLLFLKGTVLPVSVALHALLSVSPGELKVSSALSVDQNDLTLHLTLSCRAQHLYGIFTHTFTELRTQGLPQSIMIEATQPKGPEQGGSLLIKAGTCQLRAKRITGDGTKTERLWTLESKCPMFEVCCSNLFPAERFSLETFFSCYFTCSLFPFSP